MPMSGGNVTLSDLIEGVRAELGDSLNMAHSKDEFRPYQHHINAAQKDLYDAWPWIGFEFNTDIPVEAGQSEVAVPVGLDLGKKYTICTRHANKWEAIQNGVGPDQYNESDLDYVPADGYDYSNREDPIRRFELVYVDGETKFRLWPRPRTATVLRVEGRIALPKLVEMSDRCLLDAQMIILRAASNIASRRSGEDYRFIANELKKASIERFNLVKSDNSSVTNDGFAVGLSDLRDFDFYTSAPATARFRR